MKLFLLLFLLCCESFGATYYVAPTGGSDSNNGSEAQPWATWSKAMAASTNGDTVIARGGIFTGGRKYILVNNKTNYTIQAYSGETPILTTNYWSPPGSATPSLWVVNSSNITINGLTFTNNSKNAIIQNAIRVTLANCVLGQSLTTNNSSSFNVLNTSWMTLTNCVINNTGLVTSDGNDEGESVKIGAQTDTTATNTFGNRILNCTFVHGGHTLPEIASRNTVIRNCLFYNDDFFVGTNGVDTFGNRWLSFLGGNAMSNLVENCRFGYSGRPADQPADCAGIEVSTSANIIRRNQFYRARGFSVSFYQKGFTQQPRNNHVYHNSVLNSGWDTNATYYWRAAWGFMHENDSTNNSMVNNAAWMLPTNVWYFRLGATLSNLQARIAGNFDNTSNPLFVNTNLLGESVTDQPDMHLRSGSPLIDSGVWLATITSASGSGNTFTVSDSGYFYDGWGIPGEIGDLVQLQGQTTQTRITLVDYGTMTLTTADSLTWTNGQGVSLAYAGTAPDIGAYEYYNPVYYVPFRKP